MYSEDGDTSDVESYGSSIPMAETVYGTHEDSKMVMSEKVQALAGNIYEEFERMIARYDQDVVKTLMPLLVNVLECLDSAYQVNHRHDVELELLREDNEQLVTQYEREKMARKVSEQKLLEIEDAAEGDKKELVVKQEALESIVRMLELKHKNSLEQTGRLEEREGELKREYAKLHERYTDLFKTHMDHMERTKLLLSGGQMGYERQDNVSGRIGTNRMNIGRSSGPISFGFTSLEVGEGIDSEPTSPISSMHSSPSELDNVNKQTEEKALETDIVSLENKSMVTSPVSPLVAPPSGVINNNSTPSGTGRVHTKKEQRSGNNLYQELSFQDADALADMDDGADITGGWVHPGEYASSGMGKEVENLIIENTELLATKNALNVVKNDLIVKVDELTSEMDLLREEILQLNMARTRQSEHCAAIEEELRKLQEASNAAAAETDTGAEDEEDMPMVQRKRFTRVEMARVLMDRNEYKERFMELQEAVRWTDMIRASRNGNNLDKKSKLSIWKYFSRLFTTDHNSPSAGGTNTPGLTRHNTRGATVTVAAAAAASEPQLRYQASTGRVAPSLGAADHNRLAMRSFLVRKEYYNQVTAHVVRDDGRSQAYGWSIPGPGSETKVNYSQRGAQVPVPVYCQPLVETSPDLNIWCAAGVNLMGGYTKDGGLMVGGSVFYSDNPPVLHQPTDDSAVNSLDIELHLGKEAALLETKLSSLVWICTCTETKTAGIVTVIDANNPAEILNSFGVCADRILCIASVPGASPSDYLDDSASITADVIMISGSYNPMLKEDHIDADNVGRVTYIANNPTLCNKRDTRVSFHAPNDDTRSSPPVNSGIVPESCSATTTAQDKDIADVVRRGSMATESGGSSDSPGSITVTESATADDDLVAGAGKGDDGSGGSVGGSTIGSSSGVGGDDSSSGGGAKGGSPSADAQPEHTMQQAVPMSSALATMWMGAQKGRLYVHSSVANWNQCLHSVQLEDAVISIVHINGRVIVAIADGCLAIFSRDPLTGCWDLGRYHLVRIGPPRNSPRCLIAVADRVWCGYKNKVHVIDPRRLEIVYLLEAHPRKESEVREMVWFGEGVWVTIRLDSTLRLYHAYTYQHLQDVDIEPYVSKMLGAGKLNFSLVRVTALLISLHCLWIGTSNGVIISVPFSDAGVPPATYAAQRKLPGIGVRAHPSLIGNNGASSGDGRKHATAGTYIPYCSMARAHLSFHGHRDAVKFFVAVPRVRRLGITTESTTSDAPSTGKSPAAMLIMSGGEGYVDFRNGDECMVDSVIEEKGRSSNVHQPPKIEQNHLIVWQVMQQS